MHVAPDAVPRVTAHNAKTRLFGNARHRKTDIAHVTTWLSCGNAFPQTLLGNVKQALPLGLD